MYHSFFQRIEKTKRIIIYGLFLSALIYIAGYFQSVQIKSKISNLIKECELENTRLPPRPIQEINGQKILDLGQVCEPEYLIELPHNISDEKSLPNQIIGALNQKKEIDFFTKLLALCIIAISFIPFTWYFLLQRIKELREAILGK